MTYACRKTDEWQTVRYENGYGSVIAPSRQRHYPMRTTVQSLLHINPPPAHSPLFCRKCAILGRFGYLPVIQPLAVFRLPPLSFQCRQTGFSVLPLSLFRAVEEPLPHAGRARQACRKSNLCAVSHPFRPAGWMKTEPPRLLRHVATPCPCLLRLSFADLHCQKFLLGVFAFIHFRRPSAAPQLRHNAFTFSFSRFHRCRSAVARLFRIHFFAEALFS